MTIKPLALTLIADTVEPMKPGNAFLREHSPAPQHNNLVRVNVYFWWIVELLGKRCDYKEVMRTGNMKQITFIILLILFSIVTFGQTDRKRKSLFLEIAGSGGFGSFNYEKHFLKKNNTEFTWRVGFSIAPIDKNNGAGIVFPLMLHSIIGRTAHKLEFGLGQGITITTKGSFFALTTASIGYRYQPETKNWFYRVTYTPLISYLVDLQIQQWGGISIGYTFNNKSE